MVAWSATSAQSLEWGLATYSWEFVVKLSGTNDTGHQTLVVTEQGETGSGRSDDGVQQGVAVEAGVLDEAAALVELH